MKLLRLIRLVPVLAFGLVMVAVALLGAYHGIDHALSASAGQCVDLGTSVKLCLLAD